MVRLAPASRAWVLAFVFLPLLLSGLAKEETEMRCLDYGLSFIGSAGAANAVRFWVESRTRVIDEKTGLTEDFYQCASCKSENTFAAKDLFQTDNYDFMPIFGPKDTLIFRRKVYLNANYRTTYSAAEPWGGAVYRTREASPVTLLKDNAEIRRATFQGLPIVSQTEIWDERTQMRAIIECPVKTMNINEARNAYQVDTGPVLFPDLSRRHERMVDSLSLAFVAFNAPGFADFVIEAPTPVKPGDKDSPTVYHYSALKSLPARNRVYCVGKLAD
jgi:hypothetical protein